MPFKLALLDAQHQPLGASAPGFRRRAALLGLPQDEERRDGPRDGPRVLELNGAGLALRRLFPCIGSFR